MVRFGKALATFAIVASATAFASEKPADVPALNAIAFPQHVRIVAFGSSSTQGVGASREENAYPAQLQMLLRKAMPRGTTVEVLNRGVGGEDADDMMVRLERDVIARRPDLVVWQTGSNDPMRHVPVERFERETREGIAAMRKAGIEVILMEPQWSPHLDGFADANLFRDSVRKIGAETHVTVIRRWDLMHDWVRRGMVTKCEMLARDGLHMADKGYALLARWVASEVLRIQGQRTMVAAGSLVRL